MDISDFGEHLREEGLEARTAEEFMELYEAMNLINGHDTEVTNKYKRRIGKDTALERRSHTPKRMKRPATSSATHGHPVVHSPYRVSSRGREQEHLHEDRMRRGREWQQRHRGLDSYPVGNMVTKDFQDMYDLERKLSQVQKSGRNFARETFLKDFEHRYFRQKQQQKALSQNDNLAQEYKARTGEHFVDVLVGYRGLLVPDGFIGLTMKRKGPRPATEHIKPDPPPYEGYEHPYLERFRLPYKPKSDQLIKIQIHDAANEVVAFANLRYEHLLTSNRRVLRFKLSGGRDGDAIPDAHVLVKLENVQVFDVPGMRRRKTVLEISCRDLPNVEDSADPTVVAFLRDPSTEQIRMVGQTEVLTGTADPDFRALLPFDEAWNRDALLVFNIYGVHRFDRRNGGDVVRNKQLLGSVTVRVKAIEDCDLDTMELLLKHPNAVVDSMQRRGKIRKKSTIIIRKREEAVKVSHRP